MNLQTDHIFLRTPQLGDLEQMLEWENDRSLWHVGDTQEPFSREVMKKFVESVHDLDLNKQLRFVIEAKKGGLLGMIDLFDYDITHQRVALGILIDKQQRSKGFALKSVQLVLSYCFNDLLLHQVFCTVGKHNTASVSLFEKCGFSSSGVKKEWRKTKDGWEDEIIFQRFIK